MYLFTHATQPAYVEHLTEALIRMAYATDPRVEKRSFKTELAIYNYAYCAIYHGCTQKERPRMDERFYNTPRVVLARLLRERAIPWREDSADRELRWVTSYYKYIDRFYVKRLSLTPILDMLKEAHRANRPTDA